LIFFKSFDIHFGGVGVLRKKKDWDMRRMIINENFGKFGFQMASKSC
jgi:hypothetical protein